jgi:hypothetical protein
MPRCAAAGTRRGAELRAGLAGVGGLEDLAAGAGAGVVARGFAAGAVGQGFRAVHFVEMGFVDAGGRGAATRGPPTPTLPRRGGGGRGRGAAAVAHPTPRAARPSPSRGG